MIFPIIILSSYLAIRIFQMVLINLKKIFKWSKHTCKIQKTNILSHNYFSILAINLLSKIDETSVDVIVKDFINTSIPIGKEIKAFIPSKFKGPAFHCPEYVKKISIANT